MNARDQAMLGRVVNYTDPIAAVAPTLYRFEAWYGARPHKIQQRVPIVRRAIVQLEFNNRGCSGAGWCNTPQFFRIPLVSCADCLIESAQAGESGRKSNF